MFILFIIGDINIFFILRLLENAIETASFVEKKYRIKCQRINLES